MSKKLNYLYKVKIEHYCDDEHDETEQLADYLEGQGYELEIDSCCTICLEIKFKTTKELADAIEELDKHIDDFYENVYEPEDEEY